MGKGSNSNMVINNKQKMKTVIIALLISTAAIAQPNIDTVYVRNMSMQYRDWSYISAKMITYNQDSLTFFSLRKIRDVIKSLNPTPSQVIVIDSIPGKFYMEVFNRLLFTAFIETRQRGNNIYNAITGNSILLQHTTLIEASFPDYNNLEIKKGKAYLIDN